MNHRTRPKTTVQEIEKRWGIFMCWGDEPLDVIFQVLAKLDDRLKRLEKLQEQIEELESWLGKNEI